MPQVFRKFGLLRRVAALVLAVCVSSAALAQVSPPLRKNVNDIEAGGRSLAARILAGTAPKPDLDAQRAIARGDFGFLTAQERGPESTPGVLCHTPSRRPPLVRTRFGHSDVINAEVTAYYRYAEAYNHIIIENARYPYADVCAAAGSSYVKSDPFAFDLLRKPARILKRPPLTLHEAARRGTAAEVRAQLAGKPVDQLDDLRMTALTWAVAYGRGDIVTLLLAAGAKSMPAGEVSITPVQAAIGTARLELLARLTPPNPYPALYGEMAYLTNDQAMVQAVLSAPHEPLRPDLMRRLDAPSPEVAAIVAQREGKTGAQMMLFEGARQSRLDLVQLALENGADVNAFEPGGETALLAALGFGPPNPMPVVDALLRAGADPNVRYGLDTPFWRAYRLAATSYGPKPDLLPRLANAGGSARVEMRPGVPAVWTVVFPALRDLAEIIAPSDAILTTLIAAGLDLNAPYKDQCILDAVRKAEGGDGPVSQRLRKLGARARASGGVCTL